jgi:hypothetical protein
VTPELAARRLSAAIGRKVTPDDVAGVVLGEYVSLTSGETFKLYAGNAAYCGNGLWMKNGKPWDNAWEEGQEPRRLNVS